MEKTNKVKHATPIRRKHDNARMKSKVTDQNTGPQQLYEDQKRKPSDQPNLSTADLKKVRQNSHKKMNKMLLKGRKRNVEKAE